MMIKGTVILKELKESLVANFGEDINRVILFGSQARGDAHDHSDYDILVILKNDYDWHYKYKIQDTCWEVDYKFDVLTDVKIISINELNSIRGKQPYILDALENGVSA
jgi:predicted nucleotidyltransferase